MSKIVAVKDIGVPVPSGAVAAGALLVCYYGSKGFTPSYDQAERLSVPISSLAVVQVSGTPYYKFPLSSLFPSSLPDGDYDFCFTLQEGQSEGDFSPTVTETVDRTPPLALGQPVVLS